MVIESLKTQNSRNICCLLVLAQKQWFLSLFKSQFCLLSQIVPRFLIDDVLENEEYPLDIFIICIIDR